MYKIRTKFFIAFSVMVGLIAAMSLVADYSLDQVYLGVKVIKEEYRELGVLYDLQLLQQKQVSASTDYLISQNPASKKEYRLARDQFQEKFARFNTISQKVEKERDDLAHEKTEKIHITNISREYASMEDTMQQMFALPTQASWDVKEKLLNQLYRSFESLNRHIGNFRTEDQKEFQKAAKSARTVEKRSNDILWLSSLLALGFGLAFSLFFSRSITRPIIELSRGVSLIRSGNFDTRLTIKSSDEIGRLADAYNSMAQQLKDSYTLLENKVRERTVELEESNKNLQNFISEKRQMQERLNRSEKLAAIGELAAGVAHEINTPLGTIAGCAEGLLSRLEQHPLPANENFDDFTDYLKTIDNEAYHCKTITSQLLDFSRQTLPKFEQVDINSLMSLTLDVIKKQKGLDHVSFELNVPPVLSPISADASKLRQVFYNILKNSIDAIASGDGRISIQALNDVDSVIIIFQDNGCGLSQEAISKAFDPFFTTKPLGQGTGLGLSLCYGIIEQHGGQIQLESRGEGMGAKTTITLPVQQS